MDFEADFVEALQDAVTPTPADVLIARTAIMSLLADSIRPIRLSDFENAWLEAQGVSRPAERTQYRASDSDIPAPAIRGPRPYGPPPHGLPRKALRETRHS